MKKRRVSRLLAVMLAATMAINPITAGAAVDGSLELFQDGPVAAEDAAEAEIVEEFEEADAAEEMPLFDDGADAEMVEFADVAEETTALIEGDGIAENPFIIKEGTTTLQKLDGTNEIYCSFTADAMGCYQITRTWDNGERESEAKILDAGSTFNFICHSVSGTAVTIEIKQVPAIQNLEVSLPELTGYVELGGKNLHEYLCDLNPMITAMLDNNTTVKGEYRKGIQGYGSFVTLVENTDISELVPGEYEFQIKNSADWSKSTGGHSYKLKSLVEDAAVNIPVVEKSLTLLTRNCSPYYVCKLQAADEERTLSMKFQDEMNVRMYDENGVQMNDLGWGSKFAMTIPEKAAWYVRINSVNGNSGTDTINVQIDFLEKLNLTKEGTYNIPLVDYVAEYTFTPPVTGTYEFTADLADETELYLDGELIAKNYNLAHKLEAGKTYTLKTRCGGTSDNPNPESANITIKKIKAITNIEVLDTAPEQLSFIESMKPGSEFWDPWNNRLNVRLKIAFDDKLSEEKLYESWDIDMREYGFIEAKLLDKSGNQVQDNEVTEGDYTIKFNWSKDKTVVSDRTIPCKVTSVAKLGLSELKKDTPVRVGRAYKGLFMAQFTTTETSPMAYMITNENNGNIFPNYLGVYYVEDGIFKRASYESVFVAQPNVTYYMLAECREPNVETIDFILKEKGATVTGFAPVEGNSVKEPFFEEFGVSESYFNDWEFVISYSDGSKEILKNHGWSEVYGSFRCRVDSGNKKVRFYLDEDPEKDTEGHFYETGYTVKTITGAAENEITDVTDVLDTGEKLSLKEYQNKDGYFKFTAPQTGIYSFATYGTDTFRYYLNDSLKQREEFINMEAGQTLYGCVSMNQGTNVEISVRTVDETELPPKVTSIKVKDGYFGNGKLPLGAYLKNWINWYKTPLVINYDNGTTEEIRTNPWKFSKYYGRTNWNEVYDESDYSEFGTKKYTFGLEKWPERSQVYEFEIVDERKEKLPVISGEGDYDLEYNYSDYACYVFKPSEAGTYRFSINGSSEYPQLGETICTYPRSLRDMSDDHNVLENEIQNRNFSWTEEIEAGEEICIAVSLMDKSPCSLSVEKVGTFESFEFTNFPEKFIKGFDDNLSGRLNVKLHFGDGTTEEFVYGEKDSKYFGGLYARCSWEGEADPVFIADFYDYPEISTKQSINAYSLSEAEADLPKITTLGEDYIIPENYNFASCYAFTAPKKGNFVLSVTDKKGKDISGEISRSVMRLGDTWASSEMAGASVTMEQGETIYIADCYNGEDITVNVKEGSTITKIEFAEGTKEKLGKNYSWELLQEFDEELNERFFAGCEFVITYEDNNGKIETETIGYGEVPQKVPGYGKLTVNWPWDMIGDWIPVGYNQVASFDIEGSSVGCPFKGVNILRNGDANLRIPEVTEGQETMLEASGTNGTAKNFHYKNSEDAVYKITFMNQPKLQAAYAPMAMAAAEPKTDSVYIQIGDGNSKTAEVYQYDNIQQDSVIYLETSKTFTGAFYGDCDSVKIEKIDKNSLSKLSAEKTDKVKALYGDAKYSFADWTFKLDDVPLVYSSNLKHWKAGDKKEIKFTSDRGAFDIVFAPVQTDSITSDMCEIEIVTADKLGIEKITEGSVYNFSDRSIYDGNQAAYFEVEKDGYFVYNVTWRSTKNGLELLRGNDGTLLEINKDSDGIYLKAGLYTLINRGGNAQTVSITKLDKTKLTNYVNACEEELKEKDYTVLSWDAYQEALKAAKGVLEKEKTTAKELEDAYKALNTSVSGLVDIKTLREYVDSCEDENLQSGDYTTLSWETYQNALDAAKAVLANKSAKQTDIAEAYKALNAGISSLAEIKALEEYIATCEGMGLVSGDYTSSSWRTYQNALNKAKAALADAATQAEVDAALAALKAGFEGLVKDTWTPPTDPVDPPTTPTPSPTPTPIPPTAEEKETLETLYEESKELKEEDYTKATWDVFEKAMEQAKKALESNEQTLVKEAQEALEAAVAGLARMEIPVIKKVYVTGNKVTAVLKEECENADGYDFVIDKDINCVKNHKYADVSKNNTDLSGEFSYVRRGYYYAYCHAYKLVNGKKVYFSPWSKPYKFKVRAITPTAPKIQKVSVKGRTVTVTLSKGRNADGYDVILGKKVSKDRYETRPIDYGKLVKKNQKTTTIVFKNVPKGTYYVGAHGYNRTASDGSKVFSEWTAPKKIKVK